MLNAHDLSRSTAAGVCIFLARIGSIFAPFAVFLVSNGMCDELFGDNPYIFNEIYWLLDYTVKNVAIRITHVNIAQQSRTGLYNELEKMS